MDAQTMQDVLALGAMGCGGVILVTWLLGLVTGEHSWVDRIWSIVPIGYVGFFAWQTRFADLRLTVMAVLVAAWGVRLTFNFARKGGYAPGGEDYRWPILRKRMNRWQWEVFALLFIAGFQNVLLYLISLPAWVALGSTRPFGALDAIATALFVLFLVGETVADQQQWRFHQAKKAARARGETMEPPFLTTGLFRYSRHPNFFCEQAQWWVLYLFSVAATGSWLNPSIAGAVILTGLFHGSANFTEEISCSKYPSYRDYQRTTSRLLPWFPGKPVAAKAEAES